jgi:hypothetical protein
MITAIIICGVMISHAINNFRPLPYPGIFLVVLITGAVLADLINLIVRLGKS